MTETSSIDELVTLATRAAQAKQLDEASRLLDQILSADANHLRALDLFGFVRYFQGRFVEAEQFCRRALEIAPDHAYANKGLGLCLAKQGMLVEGREALERAISLKPEWPDPYWDLAVVLTEAGQYDEALKILARGQVSAPKRRGDFLAFSAQIKRRRQDNK